jgi:hypothetical protein
VPVILRHGLSGKTYVSFIDHFVYPYQLLLSGWGVGPSIAGPYDTLTFQVGLAACALAALGCLLWHDQAGSGYDRSAVDLRRSARLSLGITLVLVFLTTTLSAFLWRLLPFLAGTLTYPWQLLLLAAPHLAWLAGLGGRALLDLLPAGQREINSAPLFALLLALTLLGSLSYPNPTPVAGPVLAAPLAIFGDDEIALLDATTEGTAGPNATVAVHARWQALRPLERDYTVFLHVVGPDGQLQGQVDTMPQGNKLPTSQWQPGQVVADVYRVTLKPGEPSGGGYRYHLGLYQWQTGQRLPTAGDDKVVLTP